MKGGQHAPGTPTTLSTVTTADIQTLGVVPKWPTHQVLYNTSFPTQQPTVYWAWAPAEIPIYLPPLLIGRRLLVKNENYSLIYIFTKYPSQQAYSYSTPR